MISRYNLLKNDICIAFKRGIIVQVYKVIKNLLTKRALGSIIIKLSDDADKCFTETSMKLKAHKAWNFSVAGDVPHRVQRQLRGVTQFGRVLGLGPRCRRFKSCRLDHFIKKMKTK